MGQKYTMLRAKAIAGAGLFVFALMLAGGPRADAQSTLFNIPSTDVQGAKKLYLEMDYVGHLEDFDDGGFHAYVPRAVVGLGNNVEVGVNVPVNHLDNLHPVEVQPNIKWKFYNNEDSGVAAAAGAILYVPVKERAAFAGDDFGLLYSVVSKKVKGAYGPRITGGGYGLVGRADGLGTKGGAIIGYEQPLHAKVNFVADWLSGKNRFGYVTPGFSFATSSRSSLYAGYSIGNQGRGNNALFVYYGITLF